AIALDGNNINRVRFVRVNVDHEPEVGRQVPADFFPVVTGIVRTHDVPVLLHEQHTRTRWVHGNVVNAVTDLGVRVGNVLGAQSAVDRLPGLAAVVGAECARSRDGDEHPL